MKNNNKAKYSKSLSFMMKPHLQVIALNLLIILTRLLFKSKYLYEWDSVQYALAIDKIDILWHSPHPPGYILFVLLTRFASIFFPHPNDAILSLNIFLSMVTATIIFFLARKIFNREVALLTGILMVFNPIFWFYGEVASIYICAAFIASISGAICWYNLNHSSSHFMFAGSWAFGLMGGLRQSTVFFLFPVWLYSIIKNSRNIGKIIKHLFFFILGMLLWYIPTILLAGGLKAYNMSSNGLVQGGLEKVSILFGNLFNYYFSNTLNLIVWSLYALGISGIMFIPFAVFKYIRANEIKNIISNSKAMFFLLWFFPSFLFYAFIFLDKPGYLLIFLPALCIITAWSLIRFQLKTSLLCLILVIHTLFNILWFTYPSTHKTLFNSVNLPLAKPPLSDYVWDISSREIKQTDNQLENLNQIFNERSSKLSPYTPWNSVFVFRGGKPNWRQLCFYFPDYLNLWVIDKENSGLAHFGLEVYFSKNNRVWSSSGLPFWFKGKRPSTLQVDLPPSTRYIFWFVPRNSTFLNELSEKHFITGFLSVGELGLQIPYSIVPGNQSIGVGTFCFKKVPSLSWFSLYIKGPYFLN